MVITEHHLPFGHNPSYVTKSGWVFHTIQATYKKDKDGHPTLRTHGDILLAIRKNTFSISEKIHHQTDLYQTKSWTLSSGDFIPIIDMTGVYLSPDKKVPTYHLKSRTYTLPSIIIFTLPPRTPHKTFIVSAIMYSPEISTAGWTHNKKSTSSTTQDSRISPFELVALTLNANPKAASLIRRQLPPMPVPGAKYS